MKLSLNIKVITSFICILFIWNVSAKSHVSFRQLIDKNERSKTGLVSTVHEPYRYVSFPVSFGFSNHTERYFKTHSSKYIDLGSTLRIKEELSKTFGLTAYEAATLCLFNSNVIAIRSGIEYLNNLILKDAIYNEEISNDSLPKDVIKAIITSLVFQGAFIFIGMYMLLSYLQVRKKDYLLYSIYSLLFAVYFFIKIDLVLGLKFISNNATLLFSFSSPLLFFLTGIYVKFINVFADIKNHHKKFSREIDIFTKLMYVLTFLAFLYLIIWQDYENMLKYQNITFIPIHLYSIYAVIRAFFVIKSRLRYYIIVSNIFLIAFTILGLYNSSNLDYEQGLYANQFLGFYSFNASQFGVFLEMLCFSLGLGYKFNLIEMEKEKIKKLNTYKTKLYNNLSHEFKTPLTLISAPVKKQLQRKNIDSQTRKDLLLVDRNANKLSDLVNQLLELSKLESGFVKLKVSYTNIELFLHAIVASFLPLAAQKSLRVTTHIDVTKFAWYDADILEKIINNLLSNAIKYTPTGGRIIINCEIISGQLQLSVENDISKIVEKDLSKIFDRFYQIDVNNEGFGIGLSLIKELVTLNKGSISAQYRNNTSIVFLVKLPFEKEMFNPADIYEPSPQELKQKLDKVELRTEKLSKKEIILIVEDNLEMLDFLTSLFEPTYKVIKALDGTEGIANALKYIPDIIISDIMMPNTDGISLCKTLKNDEKTSHIPIILLTAKSGEENELIGLKTGADDYILKPFNPEKIQIRVQKLIEIRNHLRMRYQQAVTLKPKDISISAADEKFFNKLQDIIDHNLTDSEFNAKTFSKLISMSRMQLHRKLVALTGLNTTAFIKSQRLKYASTLLQNSDLRISEIAYASGFNSASYFTKSFKETYGKSPLEYSKNL